MEKQEETNEKKQEETRTRREKEEDEEETHTHKGELRRGSEKMNNCCEVGNHR